MGMFDEDQSEDAEQGEAEGTTDSQVAEAEARLQEASAYRSLMEASLFGDSDDPIGERVQKKVRAFARREIAAILGAGPGQDGLTTAEGARLKGLAQLDEAEVAVLKLLLTGLSEQEVTILRTVLVRVQQDPASLRLFLGAGVAPATKRPPAAVPGKLTVRPVVRTQAGPMVKTQAPKKAPQPVKAAPVRTEPQQRPVEEEPAVRLAKPAAKRSPTSRPMPLGDEFHIATAIKADSSFKATTKNTESYLRQRSTSEVDHMEAGENILRDPPARSQFEGSDR